MQSISTFNPPRQHGPHRIAYRYIPGARGDGGSLDNGAVMVEEFRLRKSRAKRIETLRADTRIQWVREIA